MQFMFANCYALTNLDISRVNTSRKEYDIYITNMFMSCKSLKKENIKVKDIRILKEINKIEN